MTSGPEWIEPVILFDTAIVAVAVSGIDLSEAVGRSELALTGAALRGLGLGTSTWGNPRVFSVSRCSRRSGD